MSNHPYHTVMIQIPAGKFQRDTSPKNSSSVSSFWLSPYLVTQLEFDEVMCLSFPDRSDPDKVAMPAHEVTWFDAITFCNKLSIREGRTPAYTVDGIDFMSITGNDTPVLDIEELEEEFVSFFQNNSNWMNAQCDWESNGYRLPTVMEWQWAAMGAPSDGRNGNVNRIGYRKSFPGSDGKNRLDDYVWHADNTGETMQAVGRKNPNEMGLYDMIGVVWEWCWDSTDGFPLKRKGSLDNYRGPNNGQYRILCGDSCPLFPPKTILGESHELPGAMVLNYGFRVACSDW